MQTYWRKKPSGGGHRDCVKGSYRTLVMEMMKLKRLRIWNLLMKVFKALRMQVDRHDTGLGVGVTLWHSFGGFFCLPC